MSSKKQVKIKLSVKFFTLTISQSIVENVDKILVYARNNKIYHILYENINYILIHRFKDF